MKEYRTYRASEESANTADLFASMMAKGTGAASGALAGGEEGAVVGGASSACMKKEGLTGRIQEIFEGNSI